MQIWQFLKNKLSHTTPCILLYVLQSKGSSPGRQGFKMAVADDGDLIGSIGGGIMEHKLVEKAKNMLQKEDVSIFFKHQIHSKAAAKNQSGMICSGEQTVVLYPLFLKKWQITILKIAQALDQGNKGILTLTSTGIHFSESSISKKNKPTQTELQFQYTYQSEKNWTYTEQINWQNTLHIIGGGHVGLALSRQMSLLDFYIHIYDDRPNLVTMQRNTFAHEQHTLPYPEIGQHIPSGTTHYIVIMTFGYRPDKLILRQLLDKKFAYIGMMGSKAKIAQLFKEYAEEGIPPEKLAHVHTPIGLSIHSQTPAEIGVSIAAQIIQVKNGKIC